MYKETLYRGKNLFIIRDKVLYRGVLIDFEEQDYGYKTIDLHIKINEKLKIFGIESLGSKIFIIQNDYNYYYYSDLKYIVYYDKLMIQYDKIVKFLPRNCSSKFEGFLHSTTLNNFISIINSGFIYSRSSLYNKKIYFQEKANNSVIQHTDPQILNLVRFYYYFKTPTNFIARNPIIIVINSNIIETKQLFRIYDGNAASNSSKNTSDFGIAKTFDWESIFSRGSLDIYDNETKQEIIRKRNAEFQILGEVPIKFIKKVYFIDNETMNIAKKYCDNGLSSKFFVDRSKFD